MSKEEEEYEHSAYQPPLNPELASMLQQEASQALGTYGMPQGMMLGNPASLGMMSGQFYRMPQMGGDLGLEEEPLYVNAKQYHRILKRRQARARLEAQLKIQREKKPYMHESRHRHAMRRPRGPGGRFLTASEIAELRAKEAAEGKTEEGATEETEGNDEDSNCSTVNISTLSSMAPSAVSGDTAADLPIDENGRLYHLGLKSGEVSNLIITVGDEKRARAIALMFDNAHLRSSSTSSPLSSGNESTTSIVSECPSDIAGVYAYRSSRGFLTYTGRHRGKPVSVVSIGMGYPNMDFFVREVRAITSGPLAIIRVGTCGVITGGRIGMMSIPDGGSVMIQRNYNFPFDSVNLSTETLNIPDDEPYRISRPCLPHKKLTETLIKEACLQVGSENILRGLNASSDSFYSSQGRPSTGFTDLNDRLLYQLIERGISTLEMETAQLFHLATCATKEEQPIWTSAIQIIIADRPHNEFLTSLQQRINLDQTAAQIALNAIISIDIDPSILAQVTVV